jgi:hypothetical protein
MADLQPGTQFAGCRIEGILGRGGMGVVYRATELRLGRPVALKLVAGDRAAEPELRERFTREARLTAAIEHPNVVPVYGAGEEDGHLYLIMRYVAGTDLQALLRAEGRLGPGRAADVIAQIADALDAAHAAGLVHRDVKPGNVLIGGDHVYLSDFGITRVQSGETEITDSGVWIGTVDFMSPEHLRGERTTAASDVYALGCLLHTTLTGTPPFRRTTVPATITAHLHEAPPRPSETAGVPPAFDAVIARALAKDPDERFASAGDLGRAAVAAATGGEAFLAAGSVARGEAAGEDDETVVAAGPRHDGEETSATRIAPHEATSATALAEAPMPPPRPSRPEAVRIQRGRGRKLVLAATAAVLAVPAIVAVVLLSRTTAATPSGPLSASEVRAVASAFAGAYTREDRTALRRLMALDVVRVGAGAGDRQNGRRAVVAEYSRQFHAADVERYALSDLQANGGYAGRASGAYTVTRRGAAPITGRLTLDVIRRDGHAVIGQILSEPRS